ncbi:putative RNA methylase [Rhodoblastus acidophilus]|uniref:class I SAM-dependent methyltransferase n=1 Tax=Rhodoblastus acidophilus TaxID=1074 RepID=UPI002224AA3B|nr:class I SAM-dependent methyltransferase [Rhodoblastus acidophilus]MCW2319212.1 putative RNA methylase [Rhodoblastus acidophilus]
MPLFDTTSLSTGAFGLYTGLSLGEPADDDTPETEEEAAAPAPVITRAKNFRLRGLRLLAPDWKSRAADNLAAIRLMQRIEGEARNATPEEQSRLARFISFGAGDLANNLFRRAADEALPKGWETLGQELEQLVSPIELASLARVTQYAHFTPEFIIRAMWKALRRMGFSEGRVLEPGCGSGLFFSLLPEALADKTTLSGVELDPVTARITKLLFPNAQIRNEDFTKARLPDAYDLVIGNPPFSTRTVRGADAVGALNLSLHDYFNQAVSCHLHRRAQRVLETRNLARQPRRTSLHKTEHLRRWSQSTGIDPGGGKQSTTKLRIRGSSGRCPSLGRSESFFARQFSKICLCLLSVKLSFSDNSLIHLGITYDTEPLHHPWLW